MLQKVLQPLFFAREDTMRPFRYALVALVVNAAVAIGLAPFIGYLRRRSARRWPGWAMVLLLLARRARHGRRRRALDDRFRRRLPRIVAASALMGVCLFGAEKVLEPWLYDGTTRYAALAMLVLLGLVTYYGFRGRARRSPRGRPARIAAPLALPQTRAHLCPAAGRDDEARARSR